MSEMTSLAAASTQDVNRALLLHEISWEQSVVSRQSVPPWYADDAVDFIHLGSGVVLYVMPQDSGCVTSRFRLHMGQGNSVLQPGEIGVNIQFSDSTGHPTAQLIDLYNEQLAKMEYTTEEVPGPGRRGINTGKYAAWEEFLDHHAPWSSNLVNLDDPFWAEVLTMLGERSGLVTDDSSLGTVTLTNAELDQLVNQLVPEPNDDQIVGDDVLVPTNVPEPKSVPSVPAPKVNIHHQGLQLLARTMAVCYPAALQVSLLGLFPQVDNNYGKVGWWARCQDLKSLCYAVLGVYSAPLSRAVQDVLGAAIREHSDLDAIHALAPLYGMSPEKIVKVLESLGPDMFLDLSEGVHGMGDVGYRMCPEQWVRCAHTGSVAPGEFPAPVNKLETTDVRLGSRVITGVPMSTIDDVHSADVGTGFWLYLPKWWVDMPEDRKVKWWVDNPHQVMDMFSMSHDVDDLSALDTTISDAEQFHDHILDHSSWTLLNNDEQFRHNLAQVEDIVTPDVVIHPVTTCDELVQLGAKMQICIGSSSYRSKLISGEGLFFRLSHNDNTYALHTNTAGKVVEFRGHKNSSAPQWIADMIPSFMDSYTVDNPVVYKMTELLSGGKYRINNH